MLRTFFKFLAGTIILFLLFFVVMYFSTRGDYPVMDTVQTQPSISHDTINGKALHVKTFGESENPVLIAVHGGPGYDHAYMLPLQELKDSFFIVFYDQSGCGLSARYNDPELNFEDAVSDLVSLIHTYKNEKPVYLVGHSYGAMLSIKALPSIDTLVSKIVLIEPEFLTEEAFNSYFERANFMRPRFNWTMLSFMVKQWFSSLHIEEPDKHASHDYFYGMYSRAMNIDGHPLHAAVCSESPNSLSFNRFGAVASAALMRSLFTTEGNLGIEFLSPEIQHRAKDVLFIASECNTISGEDVQRLHVEALPGSNLITIPESGYNPFYDQPNKTIRQLRLFFK